MLCESPSANESSCRRQTGVAAPRNCGSVTGERCKECSQILVGDVQMHTTDR